MAAIRRAVMYHIRVPITQNPNAPFSFSSSLNNLISRHFSDDVKPTFLDKPDVTDRVLNVFRNFAKIDTTKVTPNAHFQNDLGLDSLDTVEIVMALEEEFSFEIPDSEADKINSINTAVDFIASHPHAK